MSDHPEDRGVLPFPKRAPDATFVMLMLNALEELTNARRLLVMLPSCEFEEDNDPSDDFVDAAPWRDDYSTHLVERALALITCNVELARNQTDAKKIEAATGHAQTDETIKRAIAANELLGAGLLRVAPELFDRTREKHRVIFSGDALEARKREGCPNHFMIEVAPVSILMMRAAWSCVARAMSRMGEAINHALIIGGRHE